MSRAHELLPVGPRTEPEIYPGMELRDEHRDALMIEERFAPGPEGAPDVRVLVYTPKHATGPLPLVLEIHGGAFVHLRPDSFPLLAATHAMHGAVVVDVDYRLAPEDPFPAGPEDCYAALCWAVKELDVDTDRVIVTGGSAGGALAAAVTLMARDRGDPAIAFQALMIPVLDDRMQTPSMRDFVEAPVFGARAAEGMWLHYLGENADRSATSPYAAPARAESLTGLPPAFILVNGLDPLRDEGIEYASRLMAEGVPVELYCAADQHHGFPGDPRIAAQAAVLFDAAIAAAIKG